MLPASLRRPAPPRRRPTEHQLIHLAKGDAARMQRDLSPSPVRPRYQRSTPDRPIAGRQERGPPAGGSSGRWPAGRQTV